MVNWTVFILSSTVAISYGLKRWYEGMKDGVLQEKNLAEITKFFKLNFKITKPFINNLGIFFI